MAAVPRVIIDTDPGIDDAMALLFALGSKNLQIEGITIVAGNHYDVDMLARNACDLLDLCGRSSIPVVPGENKPLATEYHGYSGIEFHGDNGFGGVEVPTKTARRHLTTTKPFRQGGSAAEFIIQTCKANPGEITLVAVGPLTNLGRALQLCPELPSYVKRVVFMGGTTNGRGNETPSAEANLFNDPEAAALVFQHFPDVTMAGLNVTHQVSLRALLAALGNDGVVEQFIQAICVHYLKVHAKYGEGDAAVHDTFAVMAVTNPEVLTAAPQGKVAVAVETKGKYTRGATVVDWAGHWQGEPHGRKQTTVLTSVDQQAFIATFVASIRSLRATTTRASSRL